MKIKSNVHTHTTFCDGKNTVDEMVEEAVARGFDTIGFSGHSYTPFDTSYCMKDVEGYVAAVKAEKEKYRGKIDVLCGIEADFYGEFDQSLFDFVIGSVHYIKKDGECYPIDESEKSFDYLLNNVFGGDFLSLAENYFSAVTQMAEKIKPDILGHFDLIAKFNDGNRFFDENDERYKKIALDAVDKIDEKIVFELNLGAMYKGYRLAPYPQRFVLDRLCELNRPLVISSDVHDKKTLGRYFDDMADYLKDVGFSYVKVMTKNGFKNKKIR